MGSPSQRELEVYDPVANTWTVRAPMSVPRNHSAGGVINGKFYVAGGRLTTVASSWELRLLFPVGINESLNSGNYARMA
jgi:hypothetical protein